MSLPLDAVVEDYGITDSAVVDCAHLVLRIYNSESGKHVLSRKNYRKFRKRLVALSEEGRGRVYDFLRETGEDYLLLDEGKGRRYIEGARYFKRYFIMEEELTAINGNGAGPTDYHRKSHPMREKLMLLPGGKK